MSEEKYCSPLGRRVKPVYSPKVNDDGSIDLIETGKEDWYGFIQSWKDSVDIHVILKKCAMGDTSALARVQGFYADQTQYPKTKPEMLQLMIDAERNFNSLPSEIKKNFDYDVNKFIAQMDQPDWFEKIGVKPKQDMTPKEYVENEVTEE